MWLKSGANGVVGQNDLVAVKLHFGEPGNSAFIRPILVSPIIDGIHESGGKPFLTDSNTLYRGGRANAVDHLNSAMKHGFIPPAVNAPLVIADGLIGRDSVEVEVGLKHCDSVRLGSAVVHAHSLVCISHFKGHLAAGFGGAIKNMGMGVASRAGKQVQHSDVLPEIDKEKCIGCRNCIRWCPAGAIELNANGKAVIDREKCIGCAECVVSCFNKAITVRWDASPDSLQEKMVEHTVGIMKGKEGKVVFINFLINITPDCDCASWSDIPLVPDIGVLASFDPVAVDQACVDMILDSRGISKSRAEEMINKGDDKLKHVHPNIDYRRQLAYAEEVGLGTREYEIIEI